MEAGDSQLSDSEDSADTVLVPGARRALWEARARTAPAQRCAKVYTWLKMEDENGNRLSVPLQNSFEDLFAAPIRTVASSAAGGSKGSPGPRPAQQKDGSESKKRTLDGSKDNVSGDVKRTKVENGPVPVTDRKVQSSKGDSASEKGASSKGRDSVPTKNHKVQSDERRVSSDKGSSSKESGHGSGSYRDKSKEHRKRDASERSGGSSERSKTGSDSARSRTTSGGSSGCGSGTSPRSGSSSSDRKSTASASRQSSTGSRPAHKSSSKNKPHRRSSAESSASEVGSAKGGDKRKSPCKGEKDKAKSVPAKSVDKSKDKEKSASNPMPSTSKSHNDRNATTTSVIESTTSAPSVEPNGTKKERLKHASKSGDKDGKSSSSKSSEKPSSSTSDKGRATSVEKSTKSNCPDSPQKHSSEKHSTKHPKRSQSKNRHKDTSDSEKKSKSKEHSKQEKRKSSTKSHKEETSASVGCSESKKRGEKSSATREHSDSKKKTKEATAGNASSAPSAHAPDNAQCDTERANKTCDGTESLDSKTPSPIIEDKTRPRSNSSGYNDSGSCSSDLLSEEKQPSLSHSNRVKIEKVDAHTESPGDGHVSAGAVGMAPDETACRNGDRHSPSHGGVSGPGRPGEGAGDIPKHPPASPSDDGSVDSVLDDPDMEGFDEFLEGLERDISEGDFSSLKGALSSEHNSQETEADPPVRVKQEPADDGPVDVDPLSEQATEETGSVPVETADAAPKPTEASTASVAPEEPGLFSSRSVKGRISPLQPVSDDGSTGVGAPPSSGSDAVCVMAGTPPRRSLWSDSEQAIPLLEPTSPVTLPRSPHRSAAAAANDSSAVPPDGAARRAPEDWTVPADLPAPRASEDLSVDQPPLINISSSEDDDGTRRAPPSPKHIFTLSSDSDEPDVICMLEARRRQAETSQSGVQSPLKRTAHEPPEDCRPEKRAARLTEEDVMTSDVEDDEGLMASPASSQRDDVRHEPLEDSSHWEQLERVDSVAGDSTMDGDGVPSESAPIFTAGANNVPSDTAVAATDDSAVFPDATVGDSAVSPAAASAASPLASTAPAESEPTASAAAGTGTSLADQLEDIERLLTRVSAAAPSGVEFDSARVTLDRLRELLRLTADDRERDVEHFLQMCAIVVRSVFCAACQVLDVPEKNEEGAGPHGEQGGPLPADNERLTETATGASEADKHRSQHTWKQLSPSIPPELCTPIKDAFGEQYLNSVPPERAGLLVLTALRRLGPDYCPTLVSGSQLSAVFTATELGRATQWPGGKRWGNQIFSVYWSHLNADSGARGRLQRELLSGFDLLFRPPPVECPDTNLKQNMDVHCEFLPLNPFCVNETGAVAGAAGGGPPGVCRPDRTQWRAETPHGAQDTLPGSSPHPDPTRPPHSAPAAPAPLSFSGAPSYGYSCPPQGAAPSGHSGSPFCPPPLGRTDPWSHHSASRPNQLHLVCYGPQPAAFGGPQAGPPQGFNGAPMGPPHSLSGSPTGPPQGFSGSPPGFPQTYNGSPPGPSQAFNGLSQGSFHGFIDTQPGPLHHGFNGTQQGLLGHSPDHLHGSSGSPPDPCQGFHWPAPSPHYNGTQPGPPYGFNGPHPGPPHHSYSGHAAYNPANPTHPGYGGSWAGRFPTLSPPPPPPLPSSPPPAKPHPPPLLTPPAKPPPLPSKSPPKPSSPPASTEAAGAASPEPQIASGSPAAQVDYEREQLSGSGAEEQLSGSGAEEQLSGSGDEEQLSGTEEQLPGTSESCPQHAESEPETLHRAEQESEPALSCGPEPQELEQEVVSSQELELGAELELEPDRATPARSPDGESDRASLSEQDYDSDMSLGISSMEDGELGYDPGELSDAPPDSNQPAAAEPDTSARPATGQAEAAATVQAEMAAGPATGQAEALTRLATGQAEAPARPATGQGETPTRPATGQAETPARPVSGQAEAAAKSDLEQDGRTASADSVTSDQQDSDSLEEGELVSSSGEDPEPPAVRPRSRELPLQYRQPPAGRRYSRTPPRRPPSHAPSPKRAPRRRSGAPPASAVLPPSRAAPVIRQIAIDQQPFPMPNSRRGDRRAATADDEAEDISSDASLGTDSATVRAGADTPGTPPAQPRTETPVTTALAAESDGAAPETSPADVSPSKRHIINVDLMRQRLAAVRQQHSLIQPAAAVALSDALELTESVSSDSLPATAPSAAGAEDREQPEHPPQQLEQETESGEQTLSEISREESGESPRPSSQLSEVSLSSEASRSEREKRPESPPEQPPEQPPRLDQPSAAPPDESDALSAQPSTGESAARNRATRKERPVTAGAPALRQSSAAVRTPAAGGAQPGVSSSDSESDTVRVVEDTSDPELEAAPAPTPSPTGRVRSSRPAERRAGARRTAESRRSSRSARRVRAGDHHRTGRARRSSEGGYWARL